MQDAAHSGEIWSVEVEKRASGRVLHYALFRSGQPITYREVLALWRDDAAFRAFFLQRLSEAPYQAYRWETPAATEATLDRLFEFVVLESPGLERAASPRAFSNHLRDASPGDVLVFPNLGGDGIMIVPVPYDERSAYGHLAAFLRAAPEPQKHLLWKRVGEVLGRSLGSKPLWLSTAGDGVPWLHVRIDERPKYYVYTLFRDCGQLS